MRTQLSSIESFSCTAKWTEKLVALNHSKYAAGPLAARILAVATLCFVALADALIHVVFALGKACTGIVVTPYNYLASKKAPRDLELSSSVIHAIRVIDHIAMSATLPFRGLLNPDNTHQLVCHYIEDLLYKKQEETAQDIQKVSQKKESKEEIVTLQGRISQLQQNIAEKDQKITSLTQNLEKVPDSGDSGAKVSQKKESKEEIVTLQGRISQLQQSIAEIDQKITSLTQNLEKVPDSGDSGAKVLQKKLEGEIATLQRRISQFEQDMEAKDQKIISLTRDSERAYDRIKDMEEEVEEEKDQKSPGTSSPTPRQLARVGNLRKEKKADLTSLDTPPSTLLSMPPPAPPLPPQLFRLKRNLTAMTQRGVASPQFLTGIAKACKKSPIQLRRKDQSRLNLNNLEILKSDWAEIECFLNPTNKPVNTTSHGKVDLMKSFSKQNEISLVVGEHLKNCQIYYTFLKQKIESKMKSMQSDGLESSLKDRMAMMREKLEAIHHDTQGLNDEMESDDDEWSE